MHRLRLQLIGILALAILAPLLPAAFAARDLFRRSLDPLFAEGLVGGSQAGLQIARDAIAVERSRWAAALADGAPLDTLAPRELAALRLGEGGGGPGPATRVRNTLELVGAPEVVIAESLAVLVARVRAPGGSAVWVRGPLPDSLARRAAALDRGLRLLQSLQRERSVLVRGFASTFLAVYLALLVVVLGLGLLLTSRLTRPLAELSRGIDRVAAGDLTARVPERGSGEVAGLVRDFNTMADRLQTQHSELARLERLAAWRQMARFLAHEIKNPLTPIQLAAEQVREAYRGDDPGFRKLVDESAAIIAEEVAGLRNWVSEFSAFARLPEPRPDRVDAGDLAQELTALYGPSKLATRVHEGPAGWLVADRDQLKRALVNLVDNGLAAQAGAGRDAAVELEIARAADGGAAIRVSDHGPGIPPERRREVFELDFTTKTDGMGLGLAFVERIAREHGGDVRIVDGNTVGATFEIRLPAAGRAPGGTA